MWRLCIVRLCASGGGSSAQGLWIMKLTNHSAVMPASCCTCHATSGREYNIPVWSLLYLIIRISSVKRTPPTCQTVVRVKGVHLPGNNLFPRFWGSRYSVDLRTGGIPYTYEWVSTYCTYQSVNIYRYQARPFPYSLPKRSIYLRTDWVIPGMHYIYIPGT